MGHWVSGGYNMEKATTLSRRQLQYWHYVTSTVCSNYLKNEWYLHWNTIRHRASGLKRLRISRYHMLKREIPRWPGATFSLAPVSQATFIENTWIWGVPFGLNFPKFGFGVSSSSSIQNRDKNRKQKTRESFICNRSAWLFNRIRYNTVSIRYNPV